MTTTVMMKAGTALCPKFDLDFTGTADKAALEALDAKIQTFSDGYKCESTITLDTLFHAGDNGPSASTAGFLNLMYGAGLTANLAVSGAYSAVLGWGTGATGENSMVPTMKFIDGVDGIVADIKTAGGFVVGDFGEDMEAGDDGYGYELGKPATAAAAVDAAGTWILDSVLNQSFYMPTSVTGTAEGSTAKTGDRFDITDTLAFYTSGADFATGAGVFMDDKCASGVVILMGAASVAMTGVAAIASTLAI